MLFNLFSPNNYRAQIWSYTCSICYLPKFPCKIEPSCVKPNVQNFQIVTFSWPPRLSQSIKLLNVTIDWNLIDPYIYGSIPWHMSCIMAQNSSYPLSIHTCNVRNPNFDVWSSTLVLKHYHKFASHIIIDKCYFIYTFSDIDFFIFINILLLWQTKII